jgi:hypothetical protein
MTEHLIDMDEHGPLYRTPPEPRAVAAPLWYPPAIRQSWGVDGGSILAGYGRRATLHTTETTGFPAYSNGQTAPHNTVGLVGSRVEWRQHIPYNRAGRALRNPAGGVETNRTGTVQVEIIWYAGRIRDLPAQLYDALAEWARWLEAEQGIPRECHVRFLPYPDSYGASPGRLGPTAWNALVGYHGHSNVPENDHGDPGAIDIARILRAAQEDWWMADIPQDNLDQIAGAAVTALAGSKGQTAIASAVAAALAAVPTPAMPMMFVRQVNTPQVYMVAGGQLFHMSSPDMLGRYAGPDAFGKVEDYPTDAPVWQLPINGPQPGEG